MTQNVNLLCYEIATRIEADNPQDLIPHLSPKVDYRCEQDAPNLLFAYRRLIYREGTQDEAEMRRKERRYIERIIAKHNLIAKVFNIEVMLEHRFDLPAKYILQYNPVCLGAYFSEDDNEWE
ncbi:hypothetical protein Q7458_05835 [Glaesserella parasuis]|nr:hypothetical protein [Glaesserella parasuis]MDG6473692.1 hypothetical protein [Glaesserella parasuis]MDO9800219.1 hypothetical protein [Glaesserella parasuis]MDO9851011.1 hypothetical protein [Glaesserella parasuis]MDO9864746.1 hypothetical protein [Glaesserella parasuis]MDO9882224.1 hypothetical protein [Glaesserella parasuis]